MLHVYAMVQTADSILRMFVAEELLLSNRPSKSSTVKKSGKKVCKFLIRMIVPEVVVQFFSSILSSLQMREVESTFPAWLMSEAAIGWTQTSLGITALSLILARGLKMLA